MKGYDIDGVLTNGIIPEKGSVIISGRTFQEYDDFAKRAAQICPVYIRGVGAYGDRDSAGRFKARMIKELGVTEFYEDDDVQISLILEINPQCHIIKVYA